MADIMFSEQVGQTSIASTTQKNFRQMCGEVAQWNPDAPFTMVEGWVAKVYRDLIDERNWYGLKVRGILSVPAMHNAGTVTLENNSKAVVGVGTDWDSTMEGQQFRVGFTTPIYTVAKVTSATAMELDLPWGSASVAGVGYTMFQQIVSFGANVKRLRAVLNQQQGYQLKLDYPREAIDAHDTWRTAVGYTSVCVEADQSKDGTPQFELYPIPIAQQAFPFVAYVQPPDLSDSNPYPVAWIRSDVIISGAIPYALLFRGKNSKYFDQGTAAWHKREFLAAVEKMRNADDSLDLKDMAWNFSQYPMAQPSASWAQEHE